MANGLTCIVTVHGIGPQNAADDPNGVPGYADALHRNLRPILDKALGDDPERKGGGPVYVSSEDPPQSHDTEAGLKRIGTWDDAWHSVSGLALVAGSASIAHVALVYSGLEESDADPCATLVMGALGVAGAARYTNLEGLIENVGNDLKGARNLVLGATAGGAVASSAPLTPMQAVLALQEHVGGYVARNVFRERVRGFVGEAITRLAARPDITSIILNTHSNGTTVAFDVLPRIPPSLTTQLKLFVTAGSPLRKYVHLLGWGNEIERWPGMTWVNYYDLDDPVADQLQPTVDVRVTGDPDMGGAGLFTTYSPSPQPVKVVDERVSNVEAGLVAHNYWDNPNFCTKLGNRILEYSQA